MKLQIQLSSCLSFSSAQFFPLILFSKAFSVSFFRNWVNSVVCFGDVGVNSSFKLIFWQTSPVGGDFRIVSTFLLEDVRLWKAARKACHSLFMTTFLTFNDAKVEFSRMLALLYPQLMTAFISDDHDHTDSCTSLSVQLFTVPSVARTLFADGLVEVILKSFVLVCQSRRNGQGRLSFDRSTQQATVTQFKRAMFTLYDARYLLNTVPTPDQWNDALRKGFIGGSFDFRSIC